MKIIVLILTLIVAVPGMAKDCRHERAQSRELRVKIDDDGYRLDLNYNGRWRPMLTASDEIAMPRFGLARAEVAFLLKIETINRDLLVKITIINRQEESCFYDTVHKQYRDDTY